MDYSLHFSFKRLLASMLLLLVFGWVPILTHGQWKNTYHNEDHNHNHFSNERWRSGTIVAGTMINGGRDFVHLMEVDTSGSVVWENSYDFGDKQRCFDVCVISKDMVAITGTADKNLFVSVIEAGGNVLHTTYYNIRSDVQSTGLSIIYSELQKSLFVGGYAASNILDDSMHVSTGILMSLDRSLNINWTQELHYPDEVLMINDLTEVHRKGVYVTGKFTETGDTEGVLSSLYSYSGRRIWNKSFINTANSNSTFLRSAGANAVYDKNTDELFVLFNYEDIHTFAIKKMKAVSTSTPVVVYANANSLLGQLSLGNYAGFDIEIDPKGKSLLVAGMGYEQKRVGTPIRTDNSPTFIAKVDRNNAAVQWLKYLETDNIGYRDHDYDVFQAFKTTHPYINHPDLLTVIDDQNFQIIGYESNTSNQNYGLTLMNTDENGNIPFFDKCQHATSSGPDGTNVIYKPFTSEKIVPGITRKNLNRIRLNHQPESKCAIGCGFTIESIDIEYVDCYGYNFTPSISLSTNGEVLYYSWSWGDGSTTNSGTPTTYHQYDADSCSYQVCLDITFVSTTGDTCTDTYCTTAWMVLGDLSCGPCGPPVDSHNNKQGSVDGADISGHHMRWNVYPIPARDQVTIQLEEEMESGVLTLYNTTGQKVKSAAVAGTTQVILDISDLPRGLYTLELSGNGNIQREKMMIQ